MLVFEIFLQNWWNKILTFIAFLAAHCINRCISFFSHFSNIFEHIGPVFRWRYRFKTFFPFSRTFGLCIFLRLRFYLCFYISGILLNFSLFWNLSCLFRLLGYIFFYFSYKMVINQSGAFWKASKNRARSLAAAAHDYSTDAPLHKNPPKIQNSNLCS